MRNPTAMTAHLASQAVRLGWYWSVSRLIERQTRAAGLAATYKPQRPVPTFQELLADLGQLLIEDARAVGEGRYPPMPEAGDNLATYLGRVRAMIADVPEALSRRASENSESATSAPAARDGALPDYYTQDFHFQTGGYLTPESARLYDVQVETLFMGAAGPMRRRALGAVADAIHGRDQRQLKLLDVACGTGRFLRQLRLAFPRLELTGLDLSQAYLDEGRSQFLSLKGATWLAANAEAIPQPDASQDIVSCIFLFHELPPEVRRRVASEMARVLNPGGRLVFMDSLQMGDKPSWDGLLEAFPVRFHEPYFRHYAIDVDPHRTRNAVHVEADRLHKSLRLAATFRTPRPASIALRPKLTRRRGTLHSEPTNAAIRFPVRAPSTIRSLSTTRRPTVRRMCSRGSDACRGRRACSRSLCCWRTTCRSRTICRLKSCPSIRRCQPLLRPSQRQQKRQERQPQPARENIL
jgi:ubiquinone/menaquinone biosynthesis C-methylase UbiE